MSRLLVNEPVSCQYGYTILDYALLSRDPHVVKAVLNRGVKVTYKTLVQGRLIALAFANLTLFNDEILPLLCEKIEDYDQEKYHLLSKKYEQLLHLLDVAHDGLNFDIGALHKFLYEEGEDIDADIYVIERGMLLNSVLERVVTLTHLTLDEKKIAASYLLGHGARMNKLVLDTVSLNNSLRDALKNPYIAIMASTTDTAIVKFETSFHEFLKQTPNKTPFEKLMLMWFMLRNDAVLAQRHMLYAPSLWIDVTSKRDMPWFLDEVKKHDPKTYALWRLGGSLLLKQVKDQVQCNLMFHYQT